MGYHSSRRACTKKALDAIRPVYALLLATESRHPRPVDAMAASTAQQNAFLAERGVSYEEFVWSLAGEAVAV